MMKLEADIWNESYETFKSEAIVLRERALRTVMIAALVVFVHGIVLSIVKTPEWKRALALQYATLMICSLLGIGFAALRRSSASGDDNSRAPIGIARERATEIARATNRIRLMDGWLSLSRIAAALAYCWCLRPGWDAAPENPVRLWLAMGVDIIFIASQVLDFTCLTSALRRGEQLSVDLAAAQR